MATPLPYLVMANTNTQKQETSIQSPPTKQEPSLSNRGRKPTKEKPRKKIPQRGMGVAQLERLRLQERFKDTDKLESFNVLPTHLSLPDPIRSFPVHYSVNCNVLPLINGGESLSCDHHGLVVKKIENTNGSHSAQFVVNPYVFGAPDVKVRVGNGTVGSVYENSKELSSMPNVMQHFEHTTPGFDFGFKKKRFNMDNNTEKFPEMIPANVAEFIGSNPENNTVLNYHPSNFGGRAARNDIYANHHNFSKGTEVLAIRRKGILQDVGSTLMEYDFFPGKSSSSSCFKEMDFPGGGEASCLTTSDHTAHYYSATNASSSSSSSSSSFPTNSIDLSLKLSY